jgi:hypothetical protein
MQRPTTFKREKKKQEVAITFTTQKEGIFPVDPTVPAGLPHARMGMASCMVSGTLIPPTPNRRFFLCMSFVLTFGPDQSDLVFRSVSLNVYIISIDAPSWAMNYEIGMR